MSCSFEGVSFPVSVAKRKVLFSHPKVAKPLKNLKKHISIILAGPLAGPLLLECGSIVIVTVTVTAGPCQPVVR